MIHAELSLNVTALPTKAHNKTPDQVHSNFKWFKWNTYAKQHNTSFINVDNILHNGSIIICHNGIIARSLWIGCLYLQRYAWQNTYKDIYKDVTSALNENKTTRSTGAQAVVLRTCGAEPWSPPVVLGLKAEMTSNENSWVRTYLDIWNSRLFKTFQGYFK